MQNPVAADLAAKAMRQLANEQGGTVPEGTSRDPQRTSDDTTYTGHESAPSAGVSRDGSSN